MNIDYFLNLPASAQIVIGSLTAVVITNILGVFLCYRKLEAMEAHLNKCRLVSFHGSYLGNSPRGRMMRLCAVYAAIALPRLNARRGVVDLQQVQAFPRDIKILLHGTALLGVAGMAGLIITYFD
ncbi:MULTISPECIES: hypothetical protein [Pseudomonas]|uniref:hypothetical protein n=1 Tax=Pseudomonas TaxID=286 RepID=UPI001C007B39|nr:MULTISPECIES: hypothetical protein [Pseudomonas]MBT9301435.1 hypothetical protein [Pseudomonas sp. TAE6080]|tara:strand:- start:129 stop:503 length:375 start_codon:yes stop_codon:yes gene_type:complete